MPLFHTITHYITHTSRLRVIEYGTSSSYSACHRLSLPFNLRAHQPALYLKPHISPVSPPFAPTPLCHLPVVPCK